MVKKSFDQWLFEDVEIEFGIQPIEDMPLMNEWLNTQNISLNIPPHLDRLRKFLLKNINLWNEDELKIYFIAPFLLDFE